VSSASLLPNQIRDLVAPPVTDLRHAVPKARYRKCPSNGSVLKKTPFCAPDVHSSRHRTSLRD